MVQALKEPHLIHQLLAPHSLHRLDCYVLDCFLLPSFVDDGVLAPAHFLIYVIVVHFIFKLWDSFETFFKFHPLEQELKIKKSHGIKIAAKAAEERRQLSARSAK